MRKIGAIFGLAALAVVVFSPLPATAFGIHLGPFYFHVPFIGHHYRHHLHMRANPNEAEPRPNNVPRAGSYSAAARAGNGAGIEQGDQEARSKINTVESCTGRVPGVTDLPIDQIRQAVHPTTDQEAVLDDLSAASSQADEIVKASCPSSVPLTPSGRLDAAEQRLDATIKAIQIVRSPLERFYQALGDEQKRRFNAMDGSIEHARSAGNMAAACSPQGDSFIDLPAQRIQQIVQPTAQQQSAFDELKTATQNARDQLQALCPTAVPLSPVARLETLETRLKVMAEAIKSVRPRLESFYASLNDEQKARFNMMGPPPRAASSQPEPQSGGR